MAVKLSCEKYTCSRENCSRTLSVWCEQLCKLYRKIQASLTGKTARCPTRKEPNIMDIESTACNLESSTWVWMISFKAEETF